MKQSQIYLLLVLVVQTYAIIPADISAARDSLSSNPEFSNQLVDKLLDHNQNPGFELLQLKADVLAQMAINDSALLYYQKSYLAAEALNDTISLLEANHGASEIVFLQGKYDLALKYKLEYLTLVEQRGGCNKLPSAMLDVAKIQYYLQDKEASLEWQYRTNKVAQECQDKRTYRATLSNIGTIYNELGQVDSAVVYLHKAINAQRTSTDYSMLTTTNTILGNLYQSQLGLMDSASIYFEKALHFAELSGNQSSLAFVYVNLGRFNNTLENYTLAYDYLTTARNTYRKTGSFDGIVLSSHNLALTFSGLGLADSAFAVFTEVYELSRKVFTDSLAAMTSQMQVQYETQQKELENQKLRRVDALNTVTIREQKTRQQLIIVFSLSIILLIIAFGWYLRTKILFRQKQHLAELDKQNFQAVIDAEDDERARVARELHDGLGQLLSVAKLNIAGLMQDGDEQSNNMITTATGIIDEAVLEVRKISHNLMPGTLVKLGLPEAIQDLVDKINQAGILQILYQYSGLETRLENTVEINLFRIIQEILSNGVKHSKATNISLHIDKIENHLKFEYEDDGIGMDPIQISNSNGIGWKNIHSRVAMLDWVLNISRGENNGLLITIEFELEEK